MIKYLLNVEKFVENEALFVNLWMNIYGKKQIVYWAKKYSIRLLFILI